MAVAAAIGGSLIQGISANKASKAQQASASQDIRFQKETRDIIRNDLSQYREGGGLAQSALDFELGLGPRPMFGGSAPQIEEFTQSGGGMMQPTTYGATGSNGLPSNPGGSTDPRLNPTGPGAVGASGGGTRFRVNGQVFNTREEAQAFANANMTGGTAYGGYTKTPGYDFRMKQGSSAVEAGAAARGGLYSGAALRDLQNYGQDYASSEYGNYLSRLGARADTGMNAAQMSGAASQQAAAGVSNALADRGNAQSAGYMGVANAINGGIQNGIGAWSYQNNLAKGMVPNGWTQGK